MSSQPLIKTAKFAEINPDEDANLAHAVYDSYSAIVDEDGSHLDEDAAWLREQRLTHKSLHWLYRPSVVMVGFTIFMIAFAGSSAEGTRQMVVLKLACNSILQGSNREYCDPAETQVLVSSLQQAFSVARGIATIVASGKVGPLSDKYGRKIFLIGVVVFIILGALVRYTLMSTYPTLQFGPMVATEFLANFSGGGLTLVTLANCYVSDIAETNQRTYYMGINVASLFVGMSSGPLIGNLIIGFFKRKIPKVSGPGATYGPNLTSADFAPLRFEILVLLLVLLFIMFVLPESRSEHARRMSRSLSSTPSLSSLTRPQKPSRIQEFWASVNFLRPMRLLFYPKDSVHRSRHKSITRTRIAVMILAVTDCLTSSFGAALGEIFVLYGVYTFKWTAVDIGHLMAITCASRAVVLIFLSPVLTYNVFQKTLGFVPSKRRFDKIDYGVVMIALTFDCVGQIFLGTSKSSGVFLGSLVLTAVSCLAMPAVNSAIVKFYPESKMGEVFGGLAIVKNIFSIISPVAVLALYKTAVSKWNCPQVLFLGFAGFFALSGLLMTVAIVVLQGVDAEASEAEDEVR
ncbi:hypothetical protein JCM33374_g3833 [Metschnikowia sp. JCM 33374]|nr:hypothetical protein JCM33374_g3833 [Metschnikowia sp. JCM 33374]